MANRMRRRTLGFWALAALAGVVSAAVFLAAAELVALLVARESSPILAVGSFVIDIVPQPFKEFAIATFGEYDKIALLVGSRPRRAVRIGGRGRGAVPQAAAGCRGPGDRRRPLAGGDRDSRRRHAARLRSRRSPARSPGCLLLWFLVARLRRWAAASLRRLDAGRRPAGAVDADSDAACPHRSGRPSTRRALRRIRRSAHVLPRHGHRRSIRSPSSESALARSSTRPRRRSPPCAMRSASGGAVDRHGARRSRTRHPGPVAAVHARTRTSTASTPR